MRRYENPVHIIQVDHADEIEAAFRDIKSFQQQGYYLAGFTAYELGYALEPKLLTLMPETLSMPLLKFGVFEDYSETRIAETSSPELDVSLGLSPSWSPEDYAKRFNRVIDYIKAGDVYQINLTFPIFGTYQGTGEALYKALRHRQLGRYGGIVSLGGPEILSLSPELFFKTDGQDIMMRPMKGTARRQADPVQDAALRDAMKVDLKSRAENLMIVDLLRNDVSRIAQPGSVKVPELFSLETYATLHQMTSLVQAKMGPGMGFRDIFPSLFPCGSITGAPKIRAMEIIRELEDTPRGAYCGAIGYIDPDGDTCFNVAIRTLTLDKGKVTYNVGGGVVLDSLAHDEYEEALLKAKVLAASDPDLIETLRWVPGAGGLRADRHVARMIRSAKALGYPVSRSGLENALLGIQAKCAQRVRLVLNSDGQIIVETADFEPVMEKWNISLSRKPLTPEVQETRYKVSERHFYDGERRRVSAITGCHEVLFCNAKEEICEGSFTSLFAEIDGRLYTPSLSCGLLPGVLREEMLDCGKAAERTLTLDDLEAADRLFVGNSLRGLIEVILTDHGFH